MASMKVLLLSINLHQSMAARLHEAQSVPQRTVCVTTHQIGIEGTATAPSTVCSLLYPCWVAAILEDSVCCSHHVSGIPSHLRVQSRPFHTSSSLHVMSAIIARAAEEGGLI